MTPTLLLSALLSSLPTQAKPASVFQPHFKVRFPIARAVPHGVDDREVICGLTVIHKTPVDDPRILLPRRDTGAAARRIEPQDCGAATTVSPR
jgi:hypothetical protein